MDLLKPPSAGWRKLKRHTLIWYTVSPAEPTSRPSITTNTASLDAGTDFSPAG